MFDWLQLPVWVVVGSLFKKTTSKKASRLGCAGFGIVETVGCICEVFLLELAFFS